MKEIETYRDLLEVLNTFSEEQLNQNVQSLIESPVRQEVNKLEPVLAIATIDELGIKYVRSSVNNERNGNEIVLFRDYNGFGENGAVAYEYPDGVNFRDDSKRKSIFTKDHNDKKDWTGPAQKIVDEELKEKELKHSNSLGIVLRNRFLNTK